MRKSHTLFKIGLIGTLSVVNAIMVYNHSTQPITLKIAINCSDAHQSPTITIPEKSNRYVSVASLRPKACLLVRSRDHSESSFYYQEVANTPHTSVVIHDQNGGVMVFTQPD